MSERDFGDRSGRPDRGRDSNPRDRNSSPRERDAGTGSGRGGRDRRQDAPSGRGVKPNNGVSRPAWQERVARPIDYDKPKSPLIPDEITEKDLELGIRVQLKTLTPENAEKVARHLAMVSILHDQDPELAHQHALAAAERAGRIAMVRETVGVTAYGIGDYALALRELLTYRRISGSNDQVPLMVDCERGLGRPERGLELGREVDRAKLPAQVRVNLAIVMSGARLDLGQNELALAELQIPELNPEKVFDYSAPLFHAYAETLEVLGREEESKRWRKLAERAEQAFSGYSEPEDEVFSVLEEIEIPVQVDKPRESREFGDRPSRDGRESFGDRPSRDSRESRSDRQPRESFGERPARDSREPREERQPRNFDGKLDFGDTKDRGSRNDR